MAIKRKYSKEFTIGDIIYDKTSKSVYFFLKNGFFGTTRINLVKNESGTYDIVKPYVDNQGNAKTVKLGKTFEVTTRENAVVEGLTKGTLGLTTSWDADLKKEVTTTNNALYFTTHKVKEMKAINDNLIKVGWVTGIYGIEIEETQNETTTA